MPYGPNSPEVQELGRSYVDGIISVQEYTRRYNEMTIGFTEVESPAVAVAAAVDTSEEPEEEATTCQDCREPIAPSEEEEVNGRTLCQSCAEEYTSCNNCGEMTHTDDITSYENDAYCDTCYNDIFTTCDRCDETTPRDDLHSVGDSSWCHYCVDNHSWECTDCSERYSDRQSSYTVHRHGEVCESCRDGYYNCEACNDLFREDDGSYDEGRCAWYCDSCGGERNGSRRAGSGRTINDYNFKPAPVFFGNKKEMSYGVELEVIVGDEGEHADRVLEILGADHVYLKEDGSLNPEDLNGRNGYEIVTHPHTMDEHRKLWGPFFKDKPVEIVSYRYGDCGMHVHIGRKQLSPMQIQKMAVFVHAPDNLGFIEQIAQRPAGEYCKYIDKKFSSQMVSTHHKARYEAVNLANKDTIEIRIFRGTVREDRFWKNLEFVDALVHYCKLSSAKALTAKQFCAYVDNNSKDYPALHRYLIEIGRLNPSIDKFIQEVRRCA